MGSYSLALWSGRAAIFYRIIRVLRTIIRAQDTSSFPILYGPSDYRIFPRDIESNRTLHCEFGLSYSIIIYYSRVSNFFLPVFHDKIHMCAYQFIKASYLCTHYFDEVYPL